jgi:hypothetical protein
MLKKVYLEMGHLFLQHVPMMPFETISKARLQSNIDSKQRESLDQSDPTKTEPQEGMEAE